MAKWQAFGYSIRKNKRTRRITLTVRQDGSVFVTIPSWASEEIGRNFVRENESWIAKKIQEFKDKDKDKGLLPRQSRAHYLKYNGKALEEIKKKVKSFNNLYGFLINRISVRNQRARWGSCSIKGNLSFNYKIMFLEEELMDYIIVHEICHLKEPNHSKKFWKLVSLTFPDYKKMRRKLKGIV